MVIKIWGRYKSYAPEVIDEADSEKEANFMVGEYRIAFGKDYLVWAGRKRDVEEKVVPQTPNTRF